MKCKVLLAVSLLISASCVSAANPSSVNYDTSVTLEGTLKVEKGYPMLYLPAPITAVAGADSDGLYDTFKGAKKLQVVWVGNKLPTGCILATGSLFGAHTVDHKTDVLIQLASYKPCSK
ncbi:hypothetical protein [Pasteurella multocida]|uniref:hypothetical protein n=1 Tax=Pasteurella multocida TaxID=747 RepID=UPI003978DC79